MLFKCSCQMVQICACSTHACFNTFRGKLYRKTKPEVELDLITGSNFWFLITPRTRAPRPTMLSFLYRQASGGAVGGSELHYVKLSCKTLQILAPSEACRETICTAMFGKYLSESELNGFDKYKVCLLLRREVIAFCTTLTNNRLIYLLCCYSISQ